MQQHTATTTNWRSIAPKARVGDFSEFEKNPNLYQIALNGLQGLYSFLSDVQGDLQIETLETDDVNADQVISLMDTSSTAFRVGYSPDPSVLYLAVSDQMFNWIVNLPIDEIVVGNNCIYIVTMPFSYGDNSAPALAIKLKNTQNGSWMAFKDTAREVGFVCVRHDAGGMTVDEYTDTISDLRYLQ
jgi:hypothetical protein